MTPMELEMRALQLRDAAAQLAVMHKLLKGNRAARRARSGARRVADADAWYTAELKKLQPEAQALIAAAREHHEGTADGRAHVTPSN